MRHLVPFAFVLAAVSALAAAPAPARSAVRPPLVFQSDRANFTAHSFGSTIQIEPNGATVTGPASAIHLSFRRSNPHARLAPELPAGIANNFIGADPARWQSGVPLYFQVRVDRLYPGIDALVHADSATNKPEYDFEIAPHASPSRIEFAYQSPAALSLDTAGNLHIFSAGAELIERRPAAYQLIHGTRRQIPCRFTLTADNSVRFSLGTYDRALPLLIDPVLSFSTYLGGVGTDQATAITLDPSNDVYVAGITYSTALSNGEVLLFKIPPSGSVTLTRFGGTTGNSGANALTTDSSGNVYVVGYTTAADFPISSNVAIQSSVFGTQKAFIASLAPANTTVNYSAYFGGSLSDTATAVTLGPNGLLYIAGYTTSTDFLEETAAGELIPANAFQIANHGNNDGFVVSLTTGGAFNWATFVGGSSNDYVYGIALDGSSNVFLCGATQSTDFPSGAGNGSYNFQKSLRGAQNAFAAKLFPDGTQAYWSTYLGGSQSDAASACTLDTNANLYLAGTTGSTDFPTTAGAYQTTYQGGGSDGFILALTSAGAGIWGSFVGSPTDDALNAIALDASANVVVAGTTDSTVFPVTSDAVQSKNAGGQDAVILKFNNSASTLLYSTYLGGSGQDVANAVIVDSADDIFVTGTTASSNNDFPVTPGTYQPAYGGGSSDAFVSVIGCEATAPAIGAGGVVSAASFSASAISPGSIIAIFGTDLACTTSSAPSLPLSTNLGGIAVSINGTNVPLFYVGAGQINAQVPFEIAPGSATVTVTTANGTSNSAPITVVAADPAIFMVSGQAAAINSDGSLNTTSSGAATGDYISVYLTGIGLVSPSVATGAAAPANPPAQATYGYSATINGTAATVTFLGLAPGFAGLAQANITIPSSLAAGTYPLIVTVNNVSSAPASITVSN